MKSILLTTGNDIKDPRPRRVLESLYQNGNMCIFLGNFPVEMTCSNHRKNIIAPESLNPNLIGRKNSFFLKVSNSLRLLLSQLLAGEWILNSPIEISRTLLGKNYLDAFKTIDFQGADVILFDWRLLTLVDTIMRSGAGRVFYYVREFYGGQADYSILWKIKQKRLIKMIEKAFIPKVSQVVTISPGISQLYQKNYRIKKQVITDFCVPNLDTCNSNLNLTNENLIFIGNIQRDRGISIALNALKMLPGSFNLTLLGKIGDSYKKELDSVLRLGNLKSRVRLLPPVEYEQIPHLAKSFSLGLIPNPVTLPQKKFALPNKFFEYLFSGLPIICVDDSYIGDLVNQFKIGFTFDGSAEDLSEKVLRISKDDLCEIKRNIKAFLDTNSYEKSKKELIRIFY